MPCYKRKVKRGEMWRYAGSYNGKPYCSKAIYPTKKSAQEAEREYLKEAQQQAIKPRKETTLLDIVNIRLDNVKANKSKRYYDENHRYLKMLLNQIGDVSVYEITKKQVYDVITDFSAYLKKNTLNLSKIN